MAVRAVHLQRTVEPDQITRCSDVLRRHVDRIVVLERFVNIAPADNGGQKLPHVQPLV